MLNLYALSVKLAITRVIICNLCNFPNTTLDNVSLTQSFRPHYGPGLTQPLAETSRGQLKCDGTRAETIYRLSAKRTRPFKSAGGRQFSRLLAAEVCASAVVMLDTPCSEVV